MTAGEITRRPVRNSDQSFLFELYASTREAELAQVPWTSEQKHAFLTMQFTAQTQGYRQAHPQGVHEIICKADQAVGRVYFSRKEDRLHIPESTLRAGRQSEFYTPHAAASGARYSPFLGLTEL